MLIISGATSVLREFTPWDVWDGVPVPPSRGAASLRADAEAVQQPMDDRSVPMKPSSTARRRSAPTNS